MGVGRPRRAGLASRAGITNYTVRRATGPPASNPGKHSATDRMLKVMRCGYCVHGHCGSLRLTAELGQVGMKTADTRVGSQIPSFLARVLIHSSDG